MILPAACLDGGQFFEDLNQSGRIARSHGGFATFPDHEQVLESLSDCHRLKCTIAVMPTTSATAGLRNEAGGN